VSNGRQTKRQRPTNENACARLELDFVDDASGPRGTRTLNLLIKRKLVLGRPVNLRKLGAQTSLRKKSAGSALHLSPVADVTD